LLLTLNLHRVTKMNKKTKNTPKVIINGEFFCNNLSGIERFTHEITRRLDEILKKYSYDTSARQVYSIIQEYSNKK